MIYSYFMKKSSECIKKYTVKQTGITKLTITSLKIMLFFTEICVCHMLI